VKVLNTQEASALPALPGGGGQQLPLVQQQKIVSGPSSQRLSGFLQKSLIPDEKVLLLGQFPRIYTLEAMAWPLGLGWLGFWLSAKIPQTLLKIIPQVMSYERTEQVGKAVAMFFSKWPYIPFYILLFMGTWVFVSMMVRMWTTHIVLTDRRFIYKHGLLAVEMIQMNFWQIEHTDVNQSLLGSMLDYGRVLIQSYAIHQQEDSTGDEGLLRLPHIRHPYMFTRVIEDHRRAPPLGYRQYTGPVGQQGH
jgi:hypothetical protein